MASGSAGEGAGSNTDKKTSKVVIVTPLVFATSPGPGARGEARGGRYMVYNNMYMYQKTSREEIHYMYM